MIDVTLDWGQVKKEIDDDDLAIGEINDDQHNEILENNTNVRGKSQKRI